MNSVYAYIDGANLHKGVGCCGWKLDYRKFRSWMRQKFEVSEAKLFIGFLPKHVRLFELLKSCGYQLVFKEIVYDSSGKVKGNCDADLVLGGARDFFESNVTNVVLVSSDGDYAPLVRFWKEKGISCTVLSPAPVQKCSILLKKTGVPIVCLHDVRMKLKRDERNEKAPGTDVSVQGSLS